MPYSGGAPPPRLPSLESLDRVYMEMSPPPPLPPLLVWCGLGRVATEKGGAEGGRLKVLDVPMGEFSCECGGSVERELERERRLKR